MKRTIVDCAIIAIGPRSGCSTEEIENWILTSPLGKRLKDRLKIQYDQKTFLKVLRKFITKGKYQLSKRNEYKISPSRLQQISETEPSSIVYWFSFKTM